MGQESRHSITGLTCSQGCSRVVGPTDRGLIWVSGSPPFRFIHGGVFLFLTVVGLKSLFYDYWSASGNTHFYSTSTPRGYSQLLSGLSYRISHNIIAGSKILQMELQADLILSDLGKN